MKCYTCGEQIELDFSTNMWFHPDDNYPNGMRFNCNFVAQPVK